VGRHPLEFEVRRGHGLIRDALDAGGERVASVVGGIPS
jgi:hypothetical protein